MSALMPIQIHMTDVGVNTIYSTWNAKQARTRMPDARVCIYFFQNRVNGIVADAGYKIARTC